MIVTLLSDFGLKDEYVARTKGILLQHISCDHIIDISHEVAPYSTSNGSYLFKGSFQDFPQKTIHINLLDILHANPAQALIADIDGQWVISADNGFLPLLVAENTKITCYQMPVTATTYFDWIKQVAVFLGKWYGAPQLIQELPEVQPQGNAIVPSLLITENSIETTVLHIDHYGNTIFNLTKDQFELARKGRDFVISIAKNSISVSAISEDYIASTGPSKIIARFNSNDYLEISINKANASALFGYYLYSTEQIYYTLAKIDFI